jgi:16S rRNA (adenine1518-N6/adenine1519-N6)-dimethyltransferase
MRTRKRFGQHFLEAPWADKVVAAIAPSPADRFVEIGPGPGALTLRLAPRVAHLTAIEIDRDVAADLAPNLPPNVDLVEGDILDVDLTRFCADGPIRVAGNLPYNISSPILFRLIDLSRSSVPAKAGSHAPDDAARSASPGVWLPPLGGRAAAGASPPAESGSRGIVDATLMVQREVADRLEAVPGTGDYGVLSISVQLHADVRRVLALPPGAFRPPPKVHSAVVRLTFKPVPADMPDERLFTQMVRSVFTQRRKTLSNALAPFAALHGQSAPETLRAAGIDPVRRPETLALDECVRLARRFEPPGSG